MRLQFLAIVLFGILIHTSCRNQPLYEVQYRGSLRSMIHEGDISDKIDLRTFRNQQHVYALGVLENLKGEILIYGGVPIFLLSRTRSVSLTLTIIKPHFWSIRK